MAEVFISKESISEELQVHSNNANFLANTIIDEIIKRVFSQIVCKINKIIISINSDNNEQLKLQAHELNEFIQSMKKIFDDEQTIEYLEYFSVKLKYLENLSL